MIDRASAWLRHQQARWLRPDADRWVRADATRFLTPGTSIAESFPALARKYSPNQPRVPAGSPDGGQWTDGSGQRPRVIIDTTNLDAEADSDGSDSDSVLDSISPSTSAFDIGDVSSLVGTLGLFEITPRENSVQGVQLAGDPPEKLPPSIITPEEPPGIPPPERSLAERSIDFIRRAAEYVRKVGRMSPAADAFFEALRQAEGLRGETAAIKSANDPPRTLAELQARARLPDEPGYQTHHIVGQFAQNRLQFGDRMIYSPENEVRIPVVKHLDINGYYSRPNEQYGGLSPRDYLRGKSWDEQMQFGLSVLKKFGVLQ